MDLKNQAKELMLYSAINEKSAVLPGQLSKLLF